MRTYTEPQLQAYVAEHLERDGHKWFDGPVGQRWWCEPQHRLRLLGTEVRCAAGRIDILASLDRRPLIIELKARRAEDAVNGQVARYRNAVASRHERIRSVARLCYMLPTPMHRPGDAIQPHDCDQGEVLSCIIAPEFSPACYHGLGTTHGLIARLTDDGDFEISPLQARRSGEETARREILELPPDRLTDLLLADAIEGVGADIGRSWVSGMCDALNRRDFPERHYLQAEA